MNDCDSLSTKETFPIPKEGVVTSRMKLAGGHLTLLIVFALTPLIGPGIDRIYQPPFAP